MCEVFQIILTHYLTLYRIMRSLTPSGQKPFEIPAFSPFPTRFSILSNTQTRINSLPNDKMLNQSKFNIFADDKIIVTQRLKFLLGRIENTVRQEDHDDPISLT